MAGQAGQFTARVTPTATGEVTLSAAEGAGTANSLPTVAASSTPLRVIKGTSGADAIDLTSAREVVVLGGGNDVVRIDDGADSLASLADIVVGVADGDSVDLSGLFNKAGTTRQYFSISTDAITTTPVAG